MQRSGNTYIAVYRAVMLCCLVGTLGIGDLRAAHAQATPLLRVSLAASTTSAAAGDVFEYAITVANNTDNARDIVLRDDIDQQLVAQRATSSAGSCQTSNPVTCVFRLAQNATATISIGVRVRSNIASTGQILNQAVAEDDLGDSIGSNTVVVAVQPAVQPTMLSATDVPPTRVPPTPVAPSALSPTATSASASSVPVTTTKTVRPTATPKPTRHRDDDDEDNDKTAENTATPEQPSATQPPPTAPILETSPQANPPQATPTLIVESAATAPRGNGTFPNVTQPDLVLAAPAASASPVPSATPDLVEPTIAPAQENAGAVIVPTAPPAARDQSGELPHTAATVPATSIALVLVGIALVLHATRRVRRANADLRDKTAIKRLMPFVWAALRHQQKTIETLDQAQKALKKGSEEQG